MPTARTDETVDAVRRRLSGARFAAVDALFVLEDGRLAGVVPLPELLAAPAAAPVRSLCKPDPIVVDCDADQEHVARLAIRHGLVTVPVRGANALFVGAVPAAGLLSILNREHVEDLHRLHGIAREVRQTTSALEDPPARRARHRLPWLLVGMLGSMAAAALVAGFDELLAKHVQVAFFLPGIVYLADAIGTQTEAIAVRGLSLARMPYGRLLGSEIRTGFWLGAVLALLALPAVWLGCGNGALAVAVALATLAAGMCATAIGLLLPIGLARTGMDPAFGSGPLATIVQDLVSIAVYMGLAHALVL